MRGVWFKSGGGGDQLIVKISLVKIEKLFANSGRGDTIVCVCVRGGVNMGGGVKVML